MGFLLKIVEGPNKGAEIALVEGVAVTLGKGDDCDVILADSTLPDAPLEISATSDSVLVGGSPLEPFHVRTFGATSLAIGPADAPWSGLVWEEVGSRKSEVDSSEIDSRESDAESPTAEPSNGETVQRSNDSTNERTNKRKRGCLGCLVALVVLLLLLAGIAWFLMPTLKETDWSKWSRGHGPDSSSGATGISGVSSIFDLSGIADRYGLVLVETNGAMRLSGNLRTRRERLAATAEAYGSQPGVELDITDDESFRAAAEDALFTLTEGALKVSVATNRCLGITGTAESPLTLQKTLESLNADLPRLRGVDVSGVRLASPAYPNPPAAGSANGQTVQAQRSTGSTAKRPAKPALPVCGILTAPFPCLVMRDGSRIFEGAALGESVILKIEADSVTLTNSTGRFTWKP